MELDPRNFYTLQQIANSYHILRRYAEAIAALDRALAIMPDNVETRANRGLSYSTGKRTPGRCARRLMQSSRKDRAPLSAPRTLVPLRSGRRDPAAAERALVELGDNPCWDEGRLF